MDARIGRHRPEYIAAMLADQTMETPPAQPSTWARRVIVATALAASTLLSSDVAPLHEAPAREPYVSTEGSLAQQRPHGLDNISRSTVRIRLGTAAARQEATTPTPQLTAEQKQLIDSLRLTKTQKKFLATTALAIQQTDARSQGVNPTVMLAQAILECSWGADSLARKYNNLFGMKYWKSDRAVSWMKPTPLIRTTEYRNGKYPYKTWARFRAFNTQADSYRAYIRDIVRLPWYQDARRYPDNDSKYLDGLLNGNMAYATTGNYKSEILSLIKRYHLERLT